MGVKKGAKTLHCVSGLTLADVSRICKGLAGEKKILPRIVADCSNLLFVFSKCTSAVSAVAGHLSRIAATGVVMVPVCDGPIRPISKQATNKRIAEKELSRIKAYHCRTKIVELKNRIAQESLTQAERDAITGDIRKIDAQMKRNETQSHRRMPHDFASELEHELNHSNAHTVDEESAGGYVEHVVVSEFQADSYMAAQIIDQAAVMVMSKDTDIPIVAGDNCISIKSFTKGKFEIVCTSEATLKHALTYLPEASKEKAQFKAAPNPVFEGISNIRLRALIMLMLGCDMFIPGMKAVNNVSALRIVSSEDRTCEEALFMSLYKQFMENSDLSKQDVDTYIDAIVYEPTNPVPEIVELLTESTTITCSARSYLYDCPTSLPRYLEQYSIDETFKSSNIFDGPSTLTCKGVGQREHIFLAREGHAMCHHCKEVVCSYCRGSIENNIFCLSCLATETIVPAHGTIGSKTILEMRAELKDVYLFDGVDELDTDEVEDAYASLSSVPNYHVDDEAVRFPLYPSLELDSSPTKWNKLYDIEFKEGAAFLHEPELTTQYVPGLLKLFGALTTFKPGNESGWKSHKSLYAALPSIILQFAFDCRVDSGYRLLMRCVRHAFDSRTQSLKNQTATLIVHEGEVGIHLSSSIPASMKSSVYCSEIAVTPTKLLCCKCSCHCGGQGKERILCVHNLPLLFLLTSLLFDGLAENMLCDLAACLRGTTWDEDDWSNEDKLEMKQNIVHLMEASGEEIVSRDLDRTSMIELLDKFLVGTETRKKWKQKIRTPPKPSELGPVSKMNFISTEKQLVAVTKLQVESDAKKRVKAVPDNGSGEKEECSIDRYEPNYVKVSLLMDAAESHSKSSGDAIGFKLLRLRSDKQITVLPREGLFSACKQAQRDWKDLKASTRIRSTPNNRRKPTRTKKSRKKMRRNGQCLPSKKKSTKTKRSTPKSSGKRSRNISTVVASANKRARIEEAKPDGVSTVASNSNMRFEGVMAVTDAAATAPDSHNAPRKKRVSIQCAKCGKNNVTHPNLKFKCVPRYPVELGRNPTLRSVIRWQRKVLLHEEVMERVAGKKSIKSKKYICSEHDFEVVTKDKSFQYNGVEMTQTFELTVPIGAGMKSSLIQSESSKGLGRDRTVRRKLNEVANTVTPRNKRGKSSPSSIESMESNLAETQLALQQVVELSSNEKQDINPAVRIASGLGLEIGNAQSVTVDGRNFFHADRVSKRCNNEIKKQSPVVSLGMRDAEVQRRTGFINEKSLLSYIFVVCNGDTKTIKARSSSLTWYEEWFLHFEYQWGRSLTRMIDVKAIFGIKSNEIVDCILKKKYDIELSGLLSWPAYASYDEDVRTRREKWSWKYQGLRPIMWDMTNIPAYSFSDADFQRLTYSEYYGENCFKGGVSVQLNGWIRAGALWPGRVSDSDYNRREGYIQKQQEFQENDLVEIDGKLEVLPFLNVYDKGYRARTVAWKNGNQGVLQPTFAPSDRRFNGRETKLSASIASDRGGNERAVNVSKRAAYISRGFRPNMDSERFDIAWRTWNFKSNFMFKPVL